MSAAEEFIASAANGAALAVVLVDWAPSAVGVGAMMDALAPGAPNRARALEILAGAFVAVARAVDAAVEGGTALVATERQELALVQLAVALCPAMHADWRPFMAMGAKANAVTNVLSRVLKDAGLGDEPLRVRVRNIPSSVKRVLVQSDDAKRAAAYVAFLKKLGPVGGVPVAAPPDVAALAKTAGAAAAKRGGEARKRRLAEVDAAAGATRADAAKRARRRDQGDPQTWD